MNLQQPNGNDATLTTNRSKVSFLLLGYVPAVLMAAGETARSLKLLFAVASSSIPVLLARLQLAAIRIIPSIIPTLIFRVTR